MQATAAGPSHRRIGPIRCPTPCLQGRSRQTRHRASTPPPLSSAPEEPFWRPVRSSSSISRGHIGRPAPARRLYLSRIRPAPFRRTGTPPILRPSGETAKRKRLMYKRVLRSSAHSFCCSAGSLPNKPYNYLTSTLQNCKVCRGGRRRKRKNQSNIATKGNLRRLKRNFNKT